MDQIDLKILSALQREPNLTIAQIGERVGLSHTPCWRRIKQMQESGVIKGRAVVLDPLKLNLEVTAFVFVRLKSHDEDALLQFEQAVADIPQIMQCYLMAAEFDYILRVITTGVQDYEAIVKRKLLHLPNVAFVNSSFALREIKNAVALPI
jgi:Lrp/AsnC family transcriptional regulator